MVTSANLLSEVILFIRDRLKANITDPIKTTRPSGEKFVMTSYPKETTRYPIVTVKGTITGDRPLGHRSEQHLVSLEIEVRIWGRQEKEKNNLSGDVYQFLRTNQYPSATSGTSTKEQLFDFGIKSMVDVDEPGEEGVKSKIHTYRYSFIAT